MNGIYILQVKNTDIELKFDFDNYKLEYPFKIDNQSFFESGNIDVEKLRRDIFDNHVFALLHDFLVLDYNFEKIPDCDNKTMRKYENTRIRFLELVDKGGDDMFSIRRI